MIAFNRSELDAEDLDGFLFGADRTALRTLVDPLRDMQDGRCFYCAVRMRDDVHIDHVMPWSLLPIDGVANLVAADARCNLDKSASVPVRMHVERALARSHLAEAATIARIPVLFRRTASAAEGMYASLPIGSLLWREIREYELHAG
ncbi:HNH endonuclease [Rhodococcus aetherivorans]